MSPLEKRRLLLAALFLLGLAGILFHVRIHPLFASGPDGRVFRWSFFIATFFPLLDTVLVTALFLRRRTAVYGYVLNGLLVIYGTVLMAHFSLAGLLAQRAPLQDWILRSTLPDIAIAWADFLVGKFLYDHWMREG